MGLTIHHREAGPETGPAVRELADRLIRAPGTDLRVVPCALGVEITPRLDYDKGTGIQTLVAAMGSRSPFVVYGGNDANDAEAMVVVRRLQGWTIGVGPHAPPSDQLLEGPEKVADWLEAVAEGLCGGGLRHA